MTITIPISFGLIMLANFVIPIFCGPTYSESIITLMILSPIIFFIGVSNVLGIQILYPQGHEKIVMFSTGIGAVINFVINLFLIPKYGHVGAAIATLVAEFFVVFCMVFIGKRYLLLKVEKRYWVYIFGTAIMCLAIYLVKLLDFEFLYSFILSLTVGIVVYLITLMISKDPLYIMTRKLVESRIKLKN